MKIFLQFVIPTILIVQACSIKHELKNINLLSARFVAQTDDTTDLFQFLIKKDGRFFYITRRNDKVGNRLTKYYSGQGTISGDTIYLNYKRKRKPNEFENYLIIEISGGWLMQPQINEAKRIFLRRYPLIFR